MLTLCPWISRPPPRLLTTPTGCGFHPVAYQGTVTRFQTALKFQIGTHFQIGLRFQMCTQFPFSEGHSISNRPPISNRHSISKRHSFSDGHSISSRPPIFVGYAFDFGMTNDSISNIFAHFTGIRFYCRNPRFFPDFCRMWRSIGKPWLKLQPLPT